MALKNSKDVTKDFKFKGDIFKNLNQEGDDLADMEMTLKSS